MSELVLQASDDLVARLAREGDPVRAIAELVWNAIDAEAKTVDVRLERDRLGAISAVCVDDDGHGISSDEVKATFGRIGDSWKKRTQKTKNGKRYLHGKFGEGRLRAFALGSRVVWTSRSSNTAGAWQQVEVSGHRSNRHVFHWDAQPTAHEESGTTVMVYNEEQRSLTALEADDALATLRSHFAPVLLNETGLDISYDRNVLDPAQEILHDTASLVAFGEDEWASELTLRIIEWRTGQHRALYFGADTHHFVHEESGSDVENQYPYSAYITWEGFDADAFAMLGLGDMAAAPIADLWQAVRKAIRNHFVARRRERRREQVEQWKRTGVYPYQGEPTSEPERAERAVFDVVSGTLLAHISKRRDDARLTLSLLREALRHDPDKLTAILHEVASLSEADRDTLTRLLSETTLSAIIRSANLVVSRRKFLAGLEHLLFDPTDSRAVGERDHLHKILERELWVFGEAYHLMSSERGLTEMLRTHLRLEGLPMRDIGPTRRWDGKTGRVDLHLAARYQEHDRVRHLVVELKAPDITLGRKELDQVEDYATTVLSNPAFSSDRSQWDFILVGTDFDDLVDNRIDGEDRDLGQFLSPPRRPGRPLVQAFVRRWRDVIDENLRRLEFVTSALEHDPSISEGLAYVKEKHADLLPNSLHESSDEQ